MLARLVSDTWNAPDTTEIFIDRDGERFRYVLDFLRDPEMFVPNGLVGRELDYFGIPHAPIHLPPNLQPGLRERVIKAGDLVFHSLGRNMVYSNGGFRQAGAVVDCRLECTNQPASGEALAAKGQELCSLAHILSDEQLSEIWIPEFGIRCCNVRVERGIYSLSDGVVIVSVKAVPFLGQGES